MYTEERKEKSKPSCTPFRHVLRDMADGEVRKFKLPSARACDSARVQAVVVGRYEKCKFTVSANYKDCVVTITRHAI